MPELPPDLEEEILSRVPAKALSRFRSTCKRWNALFKDERFTKKHNIRAAKQVLVFMLNKRRVSSLSLNLDGIDHNNNAAPFIEFKGELFIKDSHSSPSSSLQGYMFKVFHSDGLLLCNTENHRSVVWNPCTGETTFISPSNHHIKYPMFALGYGNNKSSCRNYKLLRYRSYYYTDVVEFEIYDFSTSSWRILKVAANFWIRPSGVSLKGNTYWIASDNNILRFDFSTETVGYMCLPFQESNSCTTSLTTFREEQLSVLHQKMSMSMMEIWVTTNDKIDQTVLLSWSRLFAVDLHNLSWDRWIWYWASFFIDEDKKVAVCCDNVRIDKVCVIGEHGVFREIKFGEMTNKSESAIIFNYVPSLVQIQQGT